MKGFTHFISGLAVTSFFPAAVTAAAAGQGRYFVLGGVAALLPDTLDFKFVRFFHPIDIEITPDPDRPDPAAIARTLADAVDSAAETGRPVTVKLDAVAVGPQAWQRYDARFDPLQRAVSVTIGPIVSSAQATLRPAPKRATATATTRADPFPGEQARISVDILDGPVIDLTPQPDGRIRVDFIPWHRRGSHSLLLGLLLGMAAFLIWDVTAGIVVWAGHSAHLLGDQLGFMGSSLLYPFSRRRTPGWRILHAMNPWGNRAVVWIGLLLIFWNLSRAADPDLAYPLPRLLFFGVVLPWLAIRLMIRRVANGNA